MRSLGNYRQSIDLRQRRKESHFSRFDSQTKRLGFKALISVFTRTSSNGPGRHSRGWTPFERSQPRGSIPSSTQWEKTTDFYLPSPHTYMREGTQPPRIRIPNQSRFPDAEAVA